MRRDAVIPAEPRPRPAQPGVLVVDPAPGELAIPELEALAALGLTPAVNLRRVADPHTTLSPHGGGMTVRAMKVSSAQLLTEIAGFHQGAAEVTARPG